MLQEVIILLLILVVIIITAAVYKKLARGRIISGGTSAAPTYLFSGYDGSYLWYLAELMQADGARPANDTGFVMRGEDASATYLHKSLDNLYWFAYDSGPARGDFQNTLRWPAGAPYPAHKADLYNLIAGKPYAPKITHIAKFIYDPSKKYISQSVSSDPNFRSTWSGSGIKIITNNSEYNETLRNYHSAQWEIQRGKLKAKYNTFILDFIQSKRIDNRAFVITMYVMLDGEHLRLCDYGFICVSKDEKDPIAVCLDEDTARTFPQEYPGDSADVLAQMREIVKDCEQFFRAGAHDKNYKVYNMDVIVDENNKCWLVEFNAYFKFYDMLPRPPYSDAMHGIMEWMYKWGIKPRLFK